MVVRLESGMAYAMGLSQFEYKALKSLMTWNRKEKRLEAAVSLELLDALHSMGCRDAGLLELREHLKSVRAAVDAEREKESPAPIIKPPIKADLYKHQTRALNMCLLTFGWVGPNIKE